MAVRLFVAAPLREGAEIDLPEGAARHAQVRRVQPGDTLALFDGSGPEHAAQVLAIGRREVRVRVGAPAPVERELPFAVTLALGVPANERMDALVEKAVELGVVCVQPLRAERSVLRLQGERAERRVAHWQAVAIAACEQCGRARVPQVAPVRTLASWLALPRAGVAWLASLAPDAVPLAAAAAAAGASGALAAGQAVTLLSGPEGGLTAAEEQAARSAGFVAISLGPRVLRADTAPLAMLAWLGLAAAGGALPAHGALERFPPLATAPEH